MIATNITVADLSNVLIHDVILVLIEIRLENDEISFEFLDKIWLDNQVTWKFFTNPLRTAIEEFLWFSWNKPNVMAIIRIITFGSHII